MLGENVNFRIMRLDNGEYKEIQKEGIVVGEHRRVEDEIVIENYTIESNGERYFVNGFQIDKKYSTRKILTVKCQDNPDINIYVEIDNYYRGSFGGEFMTYVAQVSSGNELRSAENLIDLIKQAIKKFWDAQNVFLDDAVYDDLLDVIYEGYLYSDNQEVELRYNYETETLSVGD